MSSSVDVLRTFLDHPDRPQDALRFDQLHGFLFAIANAPEVIMPSEWLPLVFGEPSPTFRDEDEVRAISGALLGEYNVVNEFSTNVADTDEGGVPPGCRLLDDPTANLEDDAPVTKWSRGFIKGHMWLEETWSGCLADAEPADSDSEDATEMSDALSGAFLVLGFFSSHKIVDAVLQDNPATSRSEVASTMHRAFPVAVRDYVDLGRSLQVAMEELEHTPLRRASPKIGRNDPCPCGSGRKYKKCCGVTH